MSNEQGWQSPDSGNAGQPQYQPQQFQQPTPPPGYYAQAPKPGVIPLRPLQLGEILDGAVATVRRFPALTLGVSAVVVALAQALNLLISLPLADRTRSLQETLNNHTAAPNPQELFSFLGLAAGVGALGMLISIIVSVLLNGFLTVIIGRAVLGREATLGSVLAELRPRLLSLTGLTFLYVLMVVAGLFVCLIGAPILWVFGSVAAPILVLERGTILGSLGRSFTLVKNDFWRVTGILLLTFLLSFLVGGLIQTPLTYLGGGFNGIFTGDPTAGLSTTNLVLSTIGKFISETVMAPFTCAVTALLYVDLRMRQEGMDIELARLAATPPPVQPEA
ncbi:hypothetical protein D5S17_16555 [Pseudonocardiaceae bacterium YIM PH 21723]|nr:hypothetical protein D5S17_16555 [Pseudonocardiaceae bacterium YIM PH 21723]